MGNTNSRNLFNEFLQSSYSRKFRPAKYKRYIYSIRRALRAYSLAELRILNPLELFTPLANIVARSRQGQAANAES